MTTENVLNLTYVLSEIAKGKALATETAAKIAGTSEYASRALELGLSPLHITNLLSAALIQISQNRPVPGMEWRELSDRFTILLTGFVEENPHEAPEQLRSWFIAFLDNAKRAAAERFNRFVVKTGGNGIASPLALAGEKQLALPLLTPQKKKVKRTYRKNNPACIYCKSEHVVSNGSRKALSGNVIPYFKCVDCNRSFTGNKVGQVYTTKAGLTTQFEAIKAWILGLKTPDAIPYGINKETLWHTKDLIKKGKKLHRIYPETIQKFLACYDGIGRNSSKDVIAPLKYPLYPTVRDTLLPHRKGRGTIIISRDMEMCVCGCRKMGYPAARMDRHRRGKDVVFNRVTMFMGRDGTHCYPHRGAEITESEFEKFKATAPDIPLVSLSFGTDSTVANP